ncbi:MAG: RdgB/HAM1 family non-canonical purine NTP pyrophosphatase [Prevotella sp.]
MKLILATNNEHKLSEIKDILGDGFDILSLKDVGINTDIEENGDTLLENSRIKATFVASILDKNNYPYPFIVIADDTGLLVDELNGEPGIYSARYAGGEGHDSEANMRLMLHKLEGKENRKAHFSTFITFIEKKDASTTYMKYFEGRVDGTILKEKHGTEGFGYDPIFQPDGYDKSFAELGLEIKNKISHRARAMQQLADFIKK